MQSKKLLTVYHFEEKRLFAPIHNFDLKFTVFLL